MEFKNPLFFYWYFRLCLENAQAVCHFLPQFKTRLFLPFSLIFFVSKTFMSQTSRLPRKTAFEKIKIHQKASSSWLRKDLNLLYPRKIPSFFVSDLLVSEYPAKNQVLDSAATENVAWNLSFARKRNGVLRNFIEID